MLNKNKSPTCVDRLIDLCRNDVRKTVFLVNLGTNKNQYVYGIFSHKIASTNEVNTFVSVCTLI